MAPSLTRNHLRGQKTTPSLALFVSPTKTPCHSGGKAVEQPEGGYSEA